MKICLSVVLVFSIIGCFNSRPKNDKEFLKGSSSDVKQDSSLMDMKKVRLIETVLNLPDVIRLSKLEIIKRKYRDIYILLKKMEFEDSILPIIQNGHQLNVLHNMDSLNTSEQPCYVFTKMEVKGDSAFVQMIFDITGVLVFGKLNYSEGHWVLGQEFMVGVR